MELNEVTNQIYFISKSEMNIYQVIDYYLILCVGTIQSVKHQRCHFHTVFIYVAEGPLFSMVIVNKLLFLGRHCK